MQVMRSLAAAISFAFNTARGLSIITMMAVSYTHLDVYKRQDPINKTLETLFRTHIQHGPFAGIWANHVRLYTPEKLRAAALGAGFAVEHERAFTHHSFPFIHNLVYGFGKPLLERGALPRSMAQTADRTQFDRPDAKWYNPIRIGLSLFNWFDRGNVLDEPPGRSTVNLALKARKPTG